MTEAISRRAFLAATAATLLASRVPTSTAAAARVPKLLDHILLGCDDLDRGIEALSLVEPRINLPQELVECRTHHDLCRPRFGDRTDVRQAPGQRRSQPHQPHR